MEKVALYSFSGNFRQDGEWKEPNPSFRGEFIAMRDGRIMGYCDELYDTEEEFKKSFIAGRFLMNGISFFKLSNSSRITPLLYSATNLDDEDELNALWAPVSLSTDFMTILGATLGCCPLELDILDATHFANLKVERIEYSEKKEYEINKRFDEFDRSNRRNLMLKENTGLCKFLKFSEEEEEEEEPEETEDSEKAEESKEDSGRPYYEVNDDVWNGVHPDGQMEE